MRATGVSIDARVVDASRVQLCVRCSLSTCHILDVARRRSTRGRRNRRVYCRTAVRHSKVQTVNIQYLGQWAELYRLSIRPAYLKIHWHHCPVSIFLPTVPRSMDGDLPTYAGVGVEFLLGVL